MTPAQQAIPQIGDILDGRYRVTSVGRRGEASCVDDHGNVHFLKWDGEQWQPL